MILQENIGKKISLSSQQSQSAETWIPHNIKWLPIVAKFIFHALKVSVSNSHKIVDMSDIKPGLSNASLYTSTSNQISHTHYANPTRRWGNTTGNHL